MAGNRFRFTKKKQSGTAVLAIVFGSAALAGLFIALAVSAKRGGTLSPYVGSVGVFCFLLAVLGLIFAVPRLRDDGVFPLLPRIGLITALLGALLWGFVFALGVVYG